MPDRSRTPALAILLAAGGVLVGGLVWILVGLGDGRSDARPARADSSDGAGHPEREAVTLARPAPEPEAAEAEVATDSREEPAPRAPLAGAARPAGSLDATVDRLRRLMPDRFGALTAEQAARLEELDFHGVPLTDEDLALLAQLPNLHRLGLRGTQVTDAGIGLLGGLALEHLDLRDTAVTGGCLGLIPTRELRALHLTGTKITGDDLARLPGMPGLETLKLNRLAVTDAAVESLAVYPGLRHVELDSTALTDAGLERLLVLSPHITRIEARGTQVTQEGVARLKTLYPDCEIVFQDQLAFQQLTGR